MTELDRVTRAAAIIAALFVAAPAGAQQTATSTSGKAVDEKSFKPDEPGLYANADLSYVLTAANSSSSTLGFKGDLTERWGRHSIGFAAAGIRASSSSADARYAIGTPDDFEVRVPDAEPTAASYFGRGRYDFRLFEGTTFTHTLLADENLEETDDLRVDAQFGLQVAMTKGSA